MPHPHTVSVAHEPPLQQLWAPLHVMPQPPQFLLSSLTSTQ
jgi:hypothetical protein